MFRPEDKHCKEVKLEVNQSGPAKEDIFNKKPCYLCCFDRLYISPENEKKKASNFYIVICLLFFRTFSS